MASTSTALAAQSPTSAEEFVEAVRSLLANGEAGAARRTAAEGAARFPEHEWLEKANRVMNPMKVVSKPVDGSDRTLEFAWLHEHGASYRGYWVALLKNELLASGRKLECVLEEVRARGLESKALVHRIAE